MTKTVDVVIGGGGMVGLALGIALAKGGLEVAVADPVPTGRALAAAFDGRVSALAFASVRMFPAGSASGIDLEPRAQPIDDILVTDAKLGGAPSPFSLHFDHHELGAPLGYIAENRHIRQALFAASAELPDLSVVAPAAVTDLQVDANGVTAMLSWLKKVPFRRTVAFHRSPPFRLVPEESGSCERSLTSSLSEQGEERGFLRLNGKGKMRRCKRLNVHVDNMTGEQGRESTWSARTRQRHGIVGRACGHRWLPLTAIHESFSLSPFLSRTSA